MDRRQSPHEHRLDVLVFDQALDHAFPGMGFRARPAEADQRVVLHRGAACHLSARAAGRRSHPGDHPAARVRRQALSLPAVPLPCRRELPWPRTQEWLMLFVDLGSRRVAAMPGWLQRGWRRSRRTHAELPCRRWSAGRSIFQPRAFRPADPSSEPAQSIGRSSSSASHPRQVRHRNHSHSRPRTTKPTSTNLSRIASTSPKQAARSAVAAREIGRFPTIRLALGERRWQPRYHSIGLSDEPEKPPPHSPTETRTVPLSAGEAAARRRSSARAALSSSSRRRHQRVAGGIEAQTLRADGRTGSAAERRLERGQATADRRLAQPSARPAARSEPWRATARNTRTLVPVHRCRAVRGSHDRLCIVDHQICRSLISLRITKLSEHDLTREAQMVECSRRVNRNPLIGWIGAVSPSRRPLRGLLR